MYIKRIPRGYRFITRVCHACTGFCAERILLLLLLCVQKNLKFLRGLPPCSMTVRAVCDRTIVRTGTPTRFRGLNGPELSRCVGTCENRVTRLRGERNSVVFRKNVKKITYPRGREDENASQCGSQKPRTPLVELIPVYITKYARNLPTSECTLCS